ncbi:MAG TPA: hypothetical protein VMI56_22215 [Reyranella sp.]|nr:hypothetical protein [Reyranella sp.]
MRFTILSAAILLGAGSANAQGLAGCKVGDYVAASFGGKWLPSVVVAVDPSNVYPCRIHPLGYMDTMDTSWAPSMLRPYAAATVPIAPYPDDPWVMKMKGQQAFRPDNVLPGAYECYALTGGRLEARFAMNFKVVGGFRYTDWEGKPGMFDFDPGTGDMLFHGAAHDGHRASFKQPSNPPTRNAPPNVTFQMSGDSCDLKM